MLISLLPLLRPIIFMKGAVVARQGCPALELFFVYSGQGETFSSINQSDDNHIISIPKTTFSANSCIGHKAFFGRKLWNTDVHASSSLLLLALHISDWSALVREFPREKARFEAAFRHAEFE